MNPYEKARLERARQLREQHRRQKDVLRQMIKARLGKRDPQTGFYELEKPNGGN